MQQLTEEWYQIRKTKIGASDAPIIMGVSPWKTPYQLWEQKMGLSTEKKTTCHMQRGLDLEHIAREMYEQYKGIPISPEVVFHSNIDWMMASLDGISFDGKIIVEIKCPGEKDHLEAVEGRIPEKYYPQVQHQLAVFPADRVDYVSFRDENIAIVSVYRDEDYIDTLIQAESSFVLHMRTMTAPDMVDRDYIHRDDNLWKIMSEKWIEAKKKLQSASEIEKNCREALIHMSEGKNVLGGGISICKYMKQGFIDYSSIPELKKIDLDAYRRPVSTCYRVTKKF